MTDRLYIFTRRDLKPGYQIAQSCHAAALIGDHLVRGWDGYVICLTAKDDKELVTIFDWLSLLGHKPQEFREPDMNFQMTSFSVMVPDYDWHRLKHLPLALKKNTKFRGWLKGKLRSVYE